MPYIYSILISLLLSMPLYAQEKSIITSTKPVAGIVQAIVGDTYNIDVIVEGSASIHGFQLTPSQLTMIKKADILWYIDDELEVFLKRIIASSPNVQTQPLSSTPNLTLYNYRTNDEVTQQFNQAYKRHDDHDDHAKHDDHDDHAKHDDHDDHAKHDDHNDHAKHDNHDDHAKHDDHDDHAKHDDHDDHAKHDDHDDHAKHDDHDDHHDHDGTDWHIWFDPLNVKKMGFYIADIMGQHSPEHKALYIERAQKFAQKIDTLHANIIAQTQALQGKKFIVFHDAYQYFEKRYNLHALGTITIDPEQGLSLPHMQTLRQLLANNNVECLLSEPQFTNAIRPFLNNNKNINEAIIDPLGSLIPLDDDYYYYFIRSISGVVEECLHS